MEHKTISRSETMASIIHQLRSPLSNIQLVHGVLLKNEAGNLTKEQLEQLRGANEQVKAALLTVGQLLKPDMVQVLSSQAEVSSGKCEMLVSQIIKEMQSRIDAKELTVSLNAAEHPVPVTTDWAQLKVVVGNLIDNAIKFTPEKGTITITTSYTQDTATITVGDDGIGVPESEEGRLFDKFVSLSNATEKSLNGSGLGLYFTKQIITSLGGIIQYTRNKPRGSLFTIQIPLTN